MPRQKGNSGKRWNCSPCTLLRYFFFIRDTERALDTFLTAFRTAFLATIPLFTEGLITLRRTEDLVVEVFLWIVTVGAIFSRIYQTV